MSQPASRKVLVTGGSGKAGRACVADLLSHGYSVLNVDQTPPVQRTCPFLRADLSDFGQAIDAVGSSEFFGIVHLAAIPAPRQVSDAVTFQNNIASTFHVFDAAKRLGIKNVVWASSETVLGLPFDQPPAYVPVDEKAPPRPESIYSLTKILGEEMAVQFCRWVSGMKILSFRLSNVMDPPDYLKFSGFQEHPIQRKWNLWGYIDARDAAQAFRLGLESEITGHEAFIIAAENTVMEKSNAELLQEFFPSVEIRKAMEQNETLLCIDKARTLLGFKPQHRWQDSN